ELKTLSPLSNATLTTDESVIAPPTVLLPDDFAVCETAIIRKLKQLFDPHYGGFGHHQKFPHTQALRYLIGKTEQVRDPDMEVMLLKTLDAMQNGGLQDRFEHGFFRYCTTREWSIPHYEKMLEDNLALCELFGRAAMRFHRVDYLQTAWQTMQYIENTLRDPVTGLFSGSQDADETYYQKPLLARGALKAPDVDATVYTDWNALAIPAYLALNRPMDTQHHLEKLFKQVYRADGVIHCASDGVQPVLLKDSAQLLHAMLQCHAARTGDWEKNCLELAQHIHEQFFDAQHHAFKDLATDSKHVGLLLHPQYPLAENSLMIENLLLLDQLDPPNHWKTLALETFSHYYFEFENRGIFAAPYAWTAFLLRKRKGS
ncbi:MAG: hypothetical protein Q7R47_01600, partial [Candidatus Diapherotrites archaeon]|nr:hypothetical protein [Candidatus Diapherotrites archaeon]